MEAGYVWFRIFLPHCSFSFSAFLLCSVSFQSFFFLNASLSVLWAYYSELFWLSLILHCFPRHYSMHFRIITDYLKLCLSIIETRHDWATSLSLFTFMHWRRKWQPTPVFLPGESQGRGAWWAAVYGVTQSRTRLKRLSSSSNCVPGPVLSYEEILVWKKTFFSFIFYRGNGHKIGK